MDLNYLDLATSKDRGQRPAQQSRPVIHTSGSHLVFPFTITLVARPNSDHVLPCRPKVPSKQIQLFNVAMPYEVLCLGDEVENAV